MSKLVKTSHYTGSNPLAISPVSEFAERNTPLALRASERNKNKYGNIDKSNNIPPEIQSYITAVDRDIRNIIDYVNRIPKIYIQSAEPTIPSDTFSFWKDTDDSKFYLLVNIDGDQKKVELT